jgi:hypothetical protein
MLELVRVRNFVGFWVFEMVAKAWDLNWFSGFLGYDWMLKLARENFYMVPWV